MSAAEYRLVGGPKHGELVVAEPRDHMVFVEIPPTEAEWADATIAFGPASRRGFYVEVRIAPGYLFWAGSGRGPEEPTTASIAVMDPTGDMDLTSTLLDLLALVEREGFIHGPIRSTATRDRLSGKWRRGFTTVTVRGNLQ